MSEPLSDLEMTRLCAVAMGYYVDEWSKLAPSNSKSGVCICTARGMPWEDYDPLHDKAQCFELVERFGLSISKTRSGIWIIADPELIVGSATDIDLSRAIVTALARMQQAKALTGADSGKAG